MIQQHPGITIEDVLTRESHIDWVVMTLQSPLKERETMLDENATVLKIFATIKFKSYINIPMRPQPFCFPFSSKIVLSNISSSLYTTSYLKYKIERISKLSWVRNLCLYQKFQRVYSCYIFFLHAHNLCKYHYKKYHPLNKMGMY